MDIATSRPKDPESRRVEAFNMYMNLRQDPLVNPDGLVKYLVSAYRDVDFAQIFTQQQQDSGNAPV